MENMMNTLLGFLCCITLGNSVALTTQVNEKCYRIIGFCCTIMGTLAMTLNFLTDYKFLLPIICIIAILSTVTVYLFLLKTSSKNKDNNYIQ